MSYRETIEKYFDQAVEEFEVNPLAGKFLRRLAKESPTLFVPAAIRHLLAGGTSKAHRCLVSLAIRVDCLPAFLADPDAVTFENAQKLFKRFMEADPAFDVTMARWLPNRSSIRQAEAFDAGRCTRTLDLLDLHSGGRRLLPILSHLPDAADPRVAAKATLFVGKRMQNPAWVAGLLSRADSRVRANAVESIWGLKTRGAVQLLEKCSADQNNRVMGNALVGLHIAGREGIEDVLLSHSQVAERRPMAEWAMRKLAEGEQSRD
jgi:hypothetical protein